MFVEIPENAKATDAAAPADAAQNPFHLLSYSDRLPGIRRRSNMKGRIGQ
jgi:hypothetical protein